MSSYPAGNVTGLFLYCTQHSLVALFMWSKCGAWNDAFFSWLQCLLRIASPHPSSMVLWRPIRPRTNSPPPPQKKCPFPHSGQECKSRKPRDTWSNRQVWPWTTKWSREKANRVLPREFTGHSKHPLPTTQEKTLHMNITKWSTPKSDWLYSLQPKMERLYRFSKNKRGSWLWLRSWTLYCQIQT